MRCNSITPCILYPSNSSGQGDLNSRPHDPQSCALTGLRHAPIFTYLQITLILTPKKMILQNSFLWAQFIPIHRDHAPMFINCK